MGGGLRAAAGRVALRGGVTAAVWAAALGAASAAGLAAQAPLRVRSSTLAQRGRDLLWTLTLREPLLSSRALASERRTLCLMLERRGSGAPFAQLCLAPPPSGARGARLRFAAITGAGAGPSRAIAARIARPDIHTLTASFRPASIGIGYRSLRWQVASGLRPPACAPASAGAGEAGKVSATEGGSCLTLYPAKPRLARLHTPRLAGCVPSGRSLVFEGSPARREIALTFDDGPWNDPPSIDFVDLLARYHVPATFFEIGSQIGRYDPTGAIERRMLADGDMIGDHTWTHPVMPALSQAQQRAQIQMTSAAIRRATGFTPCLWRPPYGDTNGRLESLARSLGLLTVNWNIDPRDWSLPGVAAIESDVLANARNGAIVDMHFGGGPRRQTLAALPRIITALRARGYRFVTVTQLLGLRLIYR